MALPFKHPVDWRKLNLPTYPDVVTNPMDLGTIAKKLDRLEYDTTDALREDIELVWTNAIAFNGEGSWIEKNVNTLRQLANKKFASASMGAAGSASYNFDDGAVSTEGQSMGTKMLTAQTRLNLHTNASQLKPSELLDLQKLARKLCSQAVHEVETGEIKIDIDKMDFASFVRLDVHVRKLVAGRLPGF